MSEQVVELTATRKHRCRWPGCPHLVASKLWGCRRHWFLLPARIRNAIWRAYRPGQEETGRISDEYVEAAEAAQDYITSLRGFARR